MEKFENLLKNLTFPGYHFVLGNENGNIFVRIKYDEPDVFDGKIETQWGRKWWIEATDSEEGFLQTCFKALLTSLEHRARENFLYMNVPIMHPHRTLKEMVEMCKREERKFEPEPIPFTNDDWQIESMIKEQLEGEKMFM
ncbi:hypothetical protein C4565_00555 [Candidatus Parcubacteria bacterium]|nr:MAG: hypothetical protein C4565_00555 [Candidatus Parcubacteria bacterium]